MSLHTVAGRPAGRVLCCADFPERNFEGPSPHHIREALRVRVDSREAITKHLVTPRDRLWLDAVWQHDREKHPLLAANGFRTHLLSPPVRGEIDATAWGVSCRTVAGAGSPFVRDFPKSR